MDNLRILYKNLNLILETEIRKLKEYIEQLKSDYQQQDNKLNEIVEKTANILQEYKLIEYEIKTMQKKVIEKGEKVTSNTLNKIFQINNPDSQIIFIMKIVYEILKKNIDVIEENSNISNSFNNNKEKISNNNNKDINWEFIKKNITYKSILLLISFISETSNLNLTKEIMENATPIITKYNHYKNCYINKYPEIIIIIDFIKILIVYYTKLTLVNKLYKSNINKNNKMETIQSDLDKHSELIQKTRLLLEEITKDYNALKNNKNKNNRIIYGYNILEKYSLYEKYNVGQENIYNYDDGYYKNYCGDNKISKIKYIIKLNKKYRNKEKFILQLSSSLISYTKGIRKINKEKFIKNIKENRNISLNRKSNTDSFNKNTNNNNLMHSIESNNSSINLYKSFMTNSIVNVTRNNSTPYRSERSRNNTFLKKSFVDSYPTFDNFYQLSNRNLLLKDGLNVSSVDLEQTKNNMNYTMKNSRIKNNNNTICFRNLKQQQINLKFENEQWTPCSFCCKTIKNIYNK